MPDPVTLADLYEARRTIARWVRRTPLVPSPALSARTGASVHLKLEGVNDTGSFKIRGATNHLMHLSERQRSRGVVTVSTGNHARAVAYAAKRLGVPARVCMSELVPDHKRAAVEALGAEVRVAGSSQDDAQLAVDRMVEEEGLIPVPPFDHPHVIAGQGVIGLELLEDLPHVDYLLAGVSGGGLVSGIAVALKAAHPSTCVVGVSMERGPAMHESVRAGRPVAVEEVNTLADSLGGGIGLDNRYTFALVQRLVDEHLLLSEAEIARGMRHLYYEERIVAEGGAAVAVGALLSGKLIVAPGATVVCVVSGNNVDMKAFTRLMSERP